MSKDDPESSLAEDRELEIWESSGTFNAELPLCDIIRNAFRDGFRAGRQENLGAGFAAGIEDAVSKQRSHFAAQVDELLTRLKVLEHNDALRDAAPQAESPLGIELSKIRDRLNVLESIKLDETFKAYSNFERRLNGLVKDVGDLGKMFDVVQAVPSDLRRRVAELESKSVSGVDHSQLMNRVAALEAHPERLGSSKVLSERLTPPTATPR